MHVYHEVSEVPAGDVAKIWLRCKVCIFLVRWASYLVCLPVQGDVIILGKKREGLLMDDPEFADKLKIGLVFQNGALFDSLTVGENVGFQLLEHSHLPVPRIQVRPMGGALQQAPLFLDKA